MPRFSRILASVPSCPPLSDPTGDRQCLVINDVHLPGVFNAELRLQDTVITGIQVLARDKISQSALLKCLTMFSISSRALEV